MIRVKRTSTMGKASVSRTRPLWSFTKEIPSKIFCWAFNPNPGIPTSLFSKHACSNSWILEIYEDYSKRGEFKEERMRWICKVSHKIFVLTGPTEETLINSPIPGGNLFEKQRN